MQKNLNIDHICLAVKSIDRAIVKINKILGFEVKTKKVLNRKQNVNVVFMSKQGSIDIKLIEPGDKNSPLINFLKRGEGLHHIGFKTDNVRNTANELKSNGAKITLEPEAGEAFCNELISFSYITNGLNIELIDTDERVLIN